MFEAYIHFQHRVVQDNDLTSADPVSEQPYAELVPYRGTMDLKHMFQAPAFQADMTCAINKIFFKKKDEVHRGSVIRLTK